MLAFLCNNNHYRNDIQKMYLTKNLSWFSVTGYNSLLKMAERNIYY
nr:MAG TPA: hypothetical protein [Caudoviricetes sp.]